MIISLFEYWFLIFMHASEHVLTKREKIIKLGKSRGNYSVVY